MFLGAGSVALPVLIRNTSEVTVFSNVPSVLKNKLKSTAVPLGKMMEPNKETHFLDCSTRSKVSLAFRFVIIWIWRTELSAVEVWSLSYLYTAVYESHEPGLHQPVELVLGLIHILQSLRFYSLVGFQVPKSVDPADSSCCKVHWWVTLPLTQTRISQWYYHETFLSPRLGVKAPCLDANPFSSTGQSGNR